MQSKSALIIFSCLLSGPALSAELYVSPAGSGNCQAKSPCASIQSAVNAAAPGDTIHVAAGDYIENVTIPPGKNGVRIQGAGEDKTKVISAGGDAVPKEAPPGVPIDVVFDIISADVTIEKLAIEHPPGVPTKRDLGVFVRPPAANATIQKTAINRNRTGGALEPTNPGSRGIFVLQAKGTTISKNRLSGNYEDHLHIPSSHSTIDKNEIVDAKRVGIVIIQETSTSDSTNNVITHNTVTHCGTDGIQIQGDDNLIGKNTVTQSGSAGIRLCGAGDCVPPGVTAVASNNTVSKNVLKNNSAGDIVDNGSGNTIHP